MFHVQEPEYVDNEIPLLPRWMDRVYSEGMAPRHTPLSVAGYLLEELLWQGSFCLSELAVPIPYGAVWTDHKYEEKDAHESGMLLVDHFKEPTDWGGFRVYLRREGYCLVWRETRIDRGVGRGEWRCILRHLRIYEAVAAVRGLPGVFEVLKSVAPQFSSLCKHKSLASRATRLAYWCREVPNEIKRRKLK